MAQGLTFDYDEHADVLYLSLGKPKPAIAEELADGVLLRRDPATNAIVGLTIVDFRTSFLKRPKHLPLTLQLLSS
jgi:uncharacterized protein YuzE